MKALIAAAILAVTPIAAQAQLPQAPAPITAEEIAGRAKVCLALMEGTVTADQVKTALKLDTPQKERDFVVGCHMFLMGVAVGQSAGEAQTQGGTSI